MEFLTSKEVFIVILIAISVCIISTIYFVIERIYKKHKETKENELFNTTDNKIIRIIDNKVVVEPVFDKTIIPKKKVNAITREQPIKPIEEIKEEPKITPIVPEVEEQKVIPVVEEQKDDRLVIPIEEFKGKKEDINSIEDILKEVSQEVEKNHIDKIEYTEIEPDPEEAKEEIRKATEELLKTQELQLKEAIDLAKFEEEQEENAIISLDELYSKSKTLYEQNEVIQYEDEGNEPISLADLESRMNQIKNEVEEIEKDEKQNTLQETDTEKTPVIKLDDFNTISDNSVYKEDKVFKSSPIISPIFGIEKQTNDMEFENTADFDKFDDEIRKTNEFLKVLKELQKKLE